MTYPGHSDPTKSPTTSWKSPNEWVRVVLAGDYNLLLEEHLKLRAAARDQIEAAQEVLDVWRHYGRPVAD